MSDQNVEKSKEVSEKVSEPKSEARKKLADVIREALKNPDGTIKEPQEVLSAHPEFKKSERHLYNIHRKLKEGGLIVKGEKADVKISEPSIPKELLEKPKLEEEKPKVEPEKLAPEVIERLERISGKAIDRLLNTMDKALDISTDLGITKEETSDTGFLVMALMTKYLTKGKESDIEMTSGLHFGSIIIEKLVAWKVKKQKEKEKKEQEAKEKPKPIEPPQEAKETKTNEPEKPKPLSIDDTMKNLPEWAKKEKEV